MFIAMNFLIQLMTWICQICHEKVPHCQNDLKKCFTGWIPVPVIRFRTKLSDKQQQLLEEAYKANQFPDKSAKQIISDQTDLSLMVITNWYKNRRRKSK